MKYFGQPDFQHGEVPAVGVLLANLGTPDAPDTPSLRRYLREFLLDPRVIEMPRVLWWLILHLFVLPFRPAKSAALYRKVWTPEGSPLLVITNRQAAALQEVLRREIGTPVHVAVAMRYGNPSVRSALRELAGKGCRRILVLPLYPQYAAVTTGSTVDAVAAELTTWRWVPEIRTIHHYHDDPAYIRALAASIREVWEREGEPEKLLFSFHGIPKRYFLAGDPYFCECHKLARLAAEELAAPPRTLAGLLPVAVRQGGVAPALHRPDDHGAGEVRAPRPRRRLPRLLGGLPGDDRGDRRAEPRDLRACRRRALPLHPGPERPAGPRPLHRGPGPSQPPGVGEIPRRMERGGRAPGGRRSRGGGPRR